MSLSAVYQSYKRTVARVTVQLTNGDLSTGTAFHIGDGWLVTARHIVEGGKIQEVAGGSGKSINEGAGFSYALDVQDVIVPSEKLVDLALIKTNFSLTHYMTKHAIANPPDGFIKVDHIAIGAHLDDWLGDEFLLSKVLVMGFPRIPLSREPVLVGTEGEVNAVIDKYSEPHPHFIVSTTARGGFSGGPVIGENGVLVGVVTQSLIENGNAAELGFSSAISIEPLWDLLHANKIYPASNAQFLKEVYDSQGAG
jgi:S1-C subfamily serine protease